MSTDQKPSDAEQLALADDGVTTGTFNRNDLFPIAMGPAANDSRLACDELRASSEESFSSKSDDFDEEWRINLGTVGRWVIAGARSRLCRGRN